MGKVIIEAAINGNAMKEHNPNIPYSPEEIGRDAVATCQAGAALIHFHVREPDGTWVQTLDYYARAITLTREQCRPLMWPTFPFGRIRSRAFSTFMICARTRRPGLISGLRTWARSTLPSMTGGAKPSGADTLSTKTPTTPSAIFSRAAAS